MDLDGLIQAYEAGPALLRGAVAGMSAQQLAARPVAGKWSSAEVVCHIADFETVYADRMKRVVAEDNPTLLSGDPDAFAARLAYAARDVEEELRLVELVRRQMARILRQLPPEAFERCGNHSTDGPISLTTLLKRITRHIPHHVEFIHQKRAALGV